MQTPDNTLRIVVTGVGVCSPIGLSGTELIKNIRMGKSGIGVIRSFSTANSRFRHAAEIVDYEPLDFFTQSEAKTLDRTAQFAIVSARQAVADANIDLTSFAPERVALVSGICAGGQVTTPEAVSEPQTAQAKAKQFLETAHYVQTDAVGFSLGLHGPRATISTACASSATALAYAFEMLRSGKVDVAIAGGGDAFSYHTYAGFHALGAMAEEPCSPFSRGIGVTFGEGAGFVVLERSHDAERRGAKSHAEFSGYGSTGDAYHITSPNPAGDGLERAMQHALKMAGLNSGDIDYINAHGTGTRDNDTAETSAVRNLFSGLERAPPMSSTKSFYGHTLGAAGVLEFITSILCQNCGILPPTLNFVAGRPGCDLDYVPNQAREGRIRHFLSSSAAFGGVNTVLAGSVPGLRTNTERGHSDRIVVAGIGIVSAIGHGLEPFRQALRSGASGIREIDRFSTAGMGAHRAALIQNFKPRSVIATLDVRRMDPLNQFATVAAGLAFSDAGLDTKRIPEEKIGVVVGLSRGPVSAQEKFLNSLEKDGIDSLSAKYFPSMVVSTVGGQVSQSLGLKALNSTLVDGAGAGLHAIIHGFEMLRQNDSQDAVIVIAADEVGGMFFQLFDQAGVLDNDLSLYDPEARGTVLGEGGVALVLERASSVARRGGRVYAEITGYGLTSDSCCLHGSAKDGILLVRAMELALLEAKISSSDLDICYGHGRGIAHDDMRELHAWKKLLLEGNRRPVGCVTGNTGFCESASGAFSVAAALLSLHHGEMYPVVSKTTADGLGLIQDQAASGAYRRAIVAGSTENGNNAALILDAQPNFHSPSLERQ